MGQSAVHAWSDFFFTPQSATPIALYRIIYGLLIITDLAMLHGDWLTWYGVNGFVRLDTLLKMATTPQSGPVLVHTAGRRLD